MPTILDFKGNTPKVHDSVYLADDVFVIGDVEIGEDANVWFGSVIRGDVSYIHIGARTNIQDMTMIHVSSDFGPTIVGEEAQQRITLEEFAAWSGALQREFLTGLGARLPRVYA